LNSIRYLERQARITTGFSSERAELDALRGDFFPYSIARGAPLRAIPIKQML
jgi:hypothetical protein